MKRKKTGSTASRVRGIKISDPEFLDTPAQMFPGVWSGRIARLRVYHSSGRIFAYKAPGTNADGVGTTIDFNLIRALFLARDNGLVILCFTDNNNGIGFIDY
jgi:hypothetical protein